MTVHHKVKRYLNGDKSSNPQSDLNKLQSQYHKVQRAYVDVLHILEIGDNLNEEDTIKVVKAWRELATKRRYIRVMMQIHLHHKDYRRFMSDGIKSYNNYRYDSVFEESKSNLYTARSSTQSSDVIDLLEDLDNWEDKLPTIIICDDYNTIEMVKRGFIKNDNR